MLFTEESFPMIQQAMDCVPGGFFIYQAYGEEKLLYANSLMQAMAGCESFEELMELTGGTFRGLVHEDDLEDVEHAIYEQIESSEHSLDYVEYRMRCKGGRLRRVRDYGQLAHSETHGDVFYVFVTDIAAKYEAEIERRQVELEEAHEKQERQLSEIEALNKKLSLQLQASKALGSIYYATYFLDLDEDTYTALSAIDSLKERFGESGAGVQECLNGAARNLVHEDYRDEMLGLLDLSTIDDRLKDTDTLSMQFIGVTTGWSEGRVIASDRRADGTVKTLLWCARSIQREKARELADKVQILTMNSVFEGMSSDFVDMFFLDLDAETSTTFKRGGKIIPEDERNTKPISHNVTYIAERYVHPDDREAFLAHFQIDHMRKKLSEQDKCDQRFRMMMPDGVHHFQSRFMRVCDNGRELVFGGQRCVDDVVQAEIQAAEELKAARDEAEAANEAKTSFLFSMSHDIRTPMNAVIGFTELLRRYQDDPERRADCLEKIERSSGVLLSIINNVLEMARIEKGAVELSQETWDSENFNDTLYDVFDVLMAEKSIEFTHEVHVEHPHVQCDPIKLREVFLNLLSNAYKYTEPGGKVSMVLQEIPSDREGFVAYQTTISDTGIGMDADFLPHLFEEFSRENSTTVSKIEGTGLGMPIVKRLVDVMDGTIDVTSEKGVGTTFVVTIPHRIASAEDAVVVSREAVDLGAFAGKRILLAEDNDLNAEIAIEVLSETGLVVERAVDGVECVRMMRDCSPGYYDAVLMDIQMPNMDGYEATRTIRNFDDSERASVPIVAMTANAFDDDRRRSLSAGMNGHLAKPIDVNELMRTLALYLN